MAEGSLNPGVAFCIPVFEAAVAGVVRVVEEGEKEEEEGKREEEELVVVVVFSSSSSSSSSRSPGLRTFD